MTQEILREIVEVEIVVAVVVAMPVVAVVVMAELVRAPWPPRAPCRNALNVPQYPDTYATAT